MIRSKRVSLEYIFAFDILKFLSLKYCIVIVQNYFKECELWCTYICVQFLTLKYLILIFFEILQHPFVGGAEASNGEGLNRIFAERYNCRKRRRSPFTQNVPIFQFTIYTQLPIVLVFLKMPFRQISLENIVVKGRNPPTPFPPQDTYKQFWSDGEFILFRAVHNNMEMDGMAPPNCAALAALYIIV